MIQLEVFHTQECRMPVLNFPVMAEGNEQWLGDGYYFWQDYEFAKWWGGAKKCKASNKSRQYSIFKAELSFEEDDFIDTVFNEEDYYQFIKKVEELAKKYMQKYHRKPTLEEFNDFIADNNIWNEIKVIRFQDVPENNDLVEVNGYYYKKRIQLRVNEPEIITNFAWHKNFLC